MKKFLNVLVVVMAFALIMSCETAATGTVFTAPDMGSAADLGPSGATSAPAQADAIAYTSGVLNGIYGVMATLPAGPVLSSRWGVVDEDIIDQTIDFDDDVGTGHVTAHVKAEGYMRSYGPAPEETPVANTWYQVFDQFVKASSNLALSNIDCTDGTSDYTIVSAKYTQNLQMSMNMDVHTNASLEMDGVRGNYYLGLSYGFAMSVVRADGVGAKFIFSFGGVVDGSLADGDPNAELANTTGTLKVYGDDNALLYEQVITMDEFFGFDTL